MGKRRSSEDWLRDVLADGLTVLIGDGLYSRFDGTDGPRAVCRCSEGPHQRMTHAEFLAQFREHCPNGRCICQPDKGIVCGQHDPTLPHAPVSA